MKETLFYQVRQDNALSLTELALLVRQAFISLYPGTSFDDDMTALCGSENSFFLSRTGRAESIAVFVTLETLDSEILAGISRNAEEAEARVREFRSQTREFLVSIAAAEIPERVKVVLTARQPGWSLFEYLLLQSETDEGLALKPVQLQRARPLASGHLPPVPPASKAPQATPVMIPDRRLSSEELSALIDLSLGLEMLSRGMDRELPPSSPKPAETGTSSSRERDEGIGPSSCGNGNVKFP